MRYFPKAVQERFEAISHLHQNTENYLAMKGGISRSEAMPRLKERLKSLTKLGEPIKIQDLCEGICSRQYFYDSVLNDDYRFAWLMYRVDENIYLQSLWRRLNHCHQTYRDMIALDRELKDEIKRITAKEPVLQLV
jgi:hypothetical protein